MPFGGNAHCHAVAHMNIFHLMVKINDVNGYVKHSWTAQQSIASRQDVINLRENGAYCAKR